MPTDKTPLDAIVRAMKSGEHVRVTEADGRYVTWQHADRRWYRIGWNTPGPTPTEPPADAGTRPGGAGAPGIDPQSQNPLHVCDCPERPTCVPHGWAGTNVTEDFRICADHDHVDQSRPAHRVISEGHWRPLESPTAIRRWVYARPCRVCASPDHAAVYHIVGPGKDQPNGRRDPLGQSDLADVVDALNDAPPPAIDIVPKGPIAQAREPGRVGEATSDNLEQLTAAELREEMLSELVSVWRELDQRHRVRVLEERIEKLEQSIRDLTTETGAADEDYAKLGREIHGRTRS